MSGAFIHSFIHSLSHLLVTEHLLGGIPTKAESLEGRATLGT